MAAIYQWFVNVEVIFTTTLYPITDINSLNVSSAVLDGDIRPIPNEAIDTLDLALLGGSLEVWLYDLNGPDEYIDGPIVSLIAGILESALVQSVPPDDYMEFTSLTLIGGSMAPYLITVDSPDEKLDVSCAFLPTGSSMTAI